MADIEESSVGGFGQSDPTDGRQALQWQSLYPREARKSFNIEATYLAILLFIAPGAMLAAWLRAPQRWCGLESDQYEIVLKFGLAWIAGTLGGVLYSLKWLYHSVARKLWHLDRRLWRLLTPHISGGLAFGVVALIDSNIVKVFDDSILDRSARVVGVAFLIGYFSDSAIAKLTEVAETLFGTTRSRERHRERQEAPDTEDRN